MDNSNAKLFGSIAVFAFCFVVMMVICVWAWDAYVNGKIYYCTDGGTMDFICVGDWVHHPESVPQIVPRGMSEPDEILNGWSVAGLWCLWLSFVGVSILLSALMSAWFWKTMAPAKSSD